MSFFARLFGGASPEPKQSRKAAAQAQQAAAQAATRHELLRVVLRDTLTKHGIPSAWIGAEAMPSPGRQSEPTVHLKLVIKHWDPRLVTHTMAFQNSFAQRVALFDPLSSNWLSGISWQYALPEGSVVPEMPDPSAWANPAPAPAAAPADASAYTDTVVTQAPLADRKAELERQFAERDAMQHRPTQRPPAPPPPVFAAPRQADPDAEPDFQKTQPLFLPANPQPPLP
jgi:hypothetical protein